MRKSPWILSLVLLVTLGALGCQGTADDKDTGGVTLSIVDFDGLPVVVSASEALANAGLVQVEQMVVENVVLSPGATTSSLMNVEIQSYEVTYTRADTGRRTPPTLIEYVFGIAPVAGRFTLDNGPVMRLDQFNTVPLRDLIDFGYDRETGSQVIRLTVGIRFFGKTLSGKAVDSAPAYFTLDVVP